MPCCLTMRRLLILLFIAVFSQSVADLQVDDTDLLMGISNGFHPSCEELLESYANASASFTYCAIRHARPIRICSQCVKMYEYVRIAHKDILKLEDESGTACKEQLMNLDRLDVIEDGFKYISTLWGNAECGYCFDHKNDSESLVPSKTTQKFFELHNATILCVANHSLGNSTYNASVCKDCEEVYQELNRFYDQLKDTQRVCMDIRDSMNITRILWSDKIPCKKSGPQLDIILLSCSSVLAILPILFYLIARFATTEIRNRLQMQKRLAQLLKPSSTVEDETDRCPGPSPW